jgi:hypothetical protein
MAVSRVGLLVVALGLAFGVGWAVGASGRADLAVSLGQTRLRADALDVRIGLLEARIDLIGADAGAARAHLQQARAGALELQRQLRETRQAEQAGRLEIVIAHLVDADRQASTTAAGAEQAASAALTALAAVGIERK